MGRLVQMLFQLVQRSGHWSVAPLFFQLFQAGQNPIADCLRSRVKELRAGYERPSILRSVTRFFFVTTQFFALVWVCTSYGIAIYSTVWLGQVYTMSELSEPAIQTILGVGFLKVLENIFEHNEGKLFGRSRTESAAGDQEPPDS